MKNFFITTAAMIGTLVIIGTAILAIYVMVYLIPEIRGRQALIELRFTQIESSYYSVMPKLNELEREVNSVPRKYRLIKRRRKHETNKPGDS